VVVPTQYAADTTTNYEVGIKSELLDRRLSLELTGFYVDWKDIILFTSINGVGVNANGGGARSKGIEFTASFVPVPGLTLSANGAYVDAYLTKDSPVLVGGVKGDALPYTAKFAGTLGGEYERSLGGGNTKAMAGISWRYTGSRKSNFDTAYGQRRLDPFSQVDAHAGVKFDRFRLDAFVRNITNRRGILDVGPAGSALNGLVTAAIIRPRSYGLTLGVSY
jgi:iron complex outermembrane receptor protein